MKINWLIIGIGLMTIGVWYSIFTYGFLITLLCLVILSCIVGIVIKIIETMNSI